MASMKSPDFPAKPVRVPATEKDWHGLPKVIIRTGGILPPLSFVISPKCLISGKCRLAMDMAFDNISLAHSVFIPKKEAAYGTAPIPSNKLPRVMADDEISFMFSHLFLVLLKILRLIL